MDLPGGADPDDLGRDEATVADAGWSVVLVPDPPPWPRSFGWLAECEPGRALCIWYPGEPSDLELAQLRELSPRVEVELVRGTSADVPGGPVDVLLGEERLPGVLAPGTLGWAATLLVPGDHVDDRGDLAVTVRGVGAPVPSQLRLQVRPATGLLDGRTRVQGRLDARSR